ncbi:hypothetical protein LVQ78_24045 [Buttiauxella sp. A2-C2_NF]|nr:hypothetical protein [Buttiauxella ferragutiae]MCE0829051.1 hypothetical protein [Buttiauxella ferragutiae]UNK63062.1 hypothetical protein MNO13_09150 [Buttiauxella ferragutiae]
MNSHIKLIKIIADFSIFLEFTSEEQLDADTAVEMMEQMAAELQLLDAEDRQDIAIDLLAISAEYTGDKSEFVKELPESLGLI